MGNRHGRSPDGFSDFRSVVSAPPRQINRFVTSLSDISEISRRSCVPDKDSLGPDPKHR
ncbi:MAG: hypothetical protein ACPGUT_06925 [Halocynthiibacter sp.]